MREKRVAGYRGIGPNAGVYVPAACAFGYACSRVGIVAFNDFTPESGEFRLMLVEWFFSGNWIEEEETEEKTDDG